MSKVIRIIAAVADNNIIGVNNALPWEIPEELEHFKSATKNTSIIMGRKTQESIGRVLPGRENIVITTQKLEPKSGLIFASSLEDAIEKATHDTVYIIGGARLYTEGLHYAVRLDITRVHLEPQGDTFFPEYANIFTKEVSRVDCISENGIHYTLLQLIK
jgi:dihydrofolate reductase